MYYTLCMKEAFQIETERVDDIPLLLAHMKNMDIARLLDKHIPTHGNRKGMSLGNVTIVWLSHILSEANHRMNHVQDWATRRQAMIRGCGFTTFEAKDMTDDRLADVLRALSSGSHWVAVEQELMKNLIRVYDLQETCIRLDTTTVKSYADVNEQGLLQFGHSKDHRPDLTQLKLALASLDPLGMPLATEVLSGEQADDPVYLPLIARVREGLGKQGLLYVGDCKMAALKTRSTIDQQKDWYLCPLSVLQMPQEHVRQEGDKRRNEEQPARKVERITEKNERICIAEGYEMQQEVKADVDGRSHSWTERRLLIQSTRGVESEMRSLQERVEKAEKALQHIVVRKQGKPHRKTRVEIDEATQDVLKKFRVENLIEVTVQEEVQERHTRAYRGKVSAPQHDVIFTVTSMQKPEALAYEIRHLGWRVYATNQQRAQMTLEQAVEVYRDEYVVERCFERLKGHPFSIAPMYVQRDDHRIGLIRLLTLALRVFTLLEGVVRKRLQEQERELSGLYAGNPKRRTNRPTAERLLEAFSHMTLSQVSTLDLVQRHVTPLSSLQHDILLLAGLMPDIYLQLADDS